MKKNQKILDILNYIDNKDPNQEEIERIISELEDSHDLLDINK